MDLVRGVCILLVLLVHTSTAIDLSNFPHPKLLNIFNNVFGPFRMPLLMFLSGMLLHKSLKKELKPYILGKFYLIFCPFFFWSMAIYAAENRLTLEYILKTPISAPSLLWYLWFLFAYYILALVVERFSQFLPHIIVLSLGLSAILTSELRINRFAFLFAFFLLGHYYMKNSHRIVIKDWKIGIVGLVAASYASFLSVTNENYGYYKNIFYIWTQFGAIIFILWATGKYSPNQISKPLEWIGRNSIVFYVTHFPSQVYIAKFLASLDIELNDIAVYLLVFTSSILIGIAFQLARRRTSAIGVLFDFSKAILLYKNNFPRYSNIEKQ